MIVLALVTALLTGIAGGTVDAELLVYSATEQNATIGNQTVLVGPQVQVVRVTLPVERGMHTQHILIDAEGLTYDVAVTVVGKRDLRYLWWLLAIPAALILCAVRLRRGAGSS